MERIGDVMACAIRLRRTVHLNSSKSCESAPQANLQKIA
jgi:hypothetical protein